MKYTQKPITVEAIQYLGDNWHDVAVEFLGLNEVNDREDMRWNVYPSMEHRTVFLHIPKNLREPNVRESLSVQRGDWVLVYPDGETVETLSDQEFRSRFQEAA